MTSDAVVVLQTAVAPPYATRPGTRFPPGATPAPDGVNFCVVSRYATRVELLLFTDAESTATFQIVTLEPERNRSFFFFWHVFVEGLAPGVCYAWRVHGPDDTARTGRRFNSRKDLVDPWARAVSDRYWSRERATDAADDGHATLRGIVTAPLPARRAVEPRGLEEAVIYELHVGGFTRDPSSGVRAPGKFAGLIEKIPYLKDLGVTHVELLPVMAFDEQDVPRGARERELTNYWGYSTHGFHSPHPGYCTNPAEADREFRALTDALHAADIGVLLDVVLNHTAEGSADGPTVNFKGIANEIFYHLDAADKRRYRDYTGCGNTVNCNHPLVTSFILRCLEDWVEVLGADGFRFDLASVFARGPDGSLVADPPLPWAIESSRVLSRDNVSWNCGAEGHTADATINALRERQAKNFLAILMLSRGVPMLLAGDEVLRTQRGNNNAYCQNNAISWFDWRGVEARRAMLRFTRELIALRCRHTSLTLNRFFDGRLAPGRGVPDIRWHGARLGEPGWHDPNGRLLAFTLTGGADEEEDLHVIFNMADAAIDVMVPEIPGRTWHMALDSAQPSPRDILAPAQQQPHRQRHYRASPRSVVVLEART